MALFVAVMLAGWRHLTQSLSLRVRQAALSRAAEAGPQTGLLAVKVASLSVALRPAQYRR